MAYTINQGDTLGKIAAANKTTVQDIMKANPNITDPNKIQAGASLNLPSLAQSNGVRANFPSTPAPTNTTIKPAQAMPGTGNPNTNAATTNNILFGNKNTSVTPSFGTGSPSANAASTAATLTPSQWQKDLSGYLAGVQKGPTASSIPPTGSSVQSPLKQASTANVGPSTTTSTANTEASSAGSKVGNTFVMQNGTVIDANTGKVISGPTGSTQSVTYTPPASTPDGKTTPTGQAGYTDNARPIDMSYGGLIQESLKRQQDSANRIQSLQNELAGQIGQVENRAIPLEFKTGREQTLQTLAGQRIANEQANLANIGNIYGKAIGAVAPIQVSPESTLVSPVTAQAQYGIGTGPGGPGANAMTNYAQIKQNIAQGQQYQGQAAELSKTLAQYDKVAPQVVTFLERSGINNASSPWINRAINEYMLESMAPSDRATVNAMFADLKTYTAQILGSSGLNPTEVSDTVNSFDPGALNPKQLESFMQNIRSLGEIRLAPIQQAAQASYGANTAGGAYMGAPVGNNQTFSLGQTNSYPAAIVGTGAAVTGGVLNAIKGIFNSIF